MNKVKFFLVNYAQICGADINKMLLAWQLVQSRNLPNICNTRDSKIRLPKLCSHQIAYLYAPISRVLQRAVVRLGLN